MPQNGRFASKKIDAANRPFAAPLPQSNKKNRGFFWF
jgi:hypothetical protein